MILNLTSAHPFVSTKIDMHNNFNHLIKLAKLRVQSVVIDIDKKKRQRNYNDIDVVIAEFQLCQVGFIVDRFRILC